MNCECNSDGFDIYSQYVIFKCLAFDAVVRILRVIINNGFIPAHVLKPCVILIGCLIADDSRILSVINLQRNIVGSQVVVVFADCKLDRERFCVGCLLVIVTVIVLLVVSAALAIRSVT